MLKVVMCALLLSSALVACRHPELPLLNGDGRDASNDANDASTNGSVDAAGDAPPSPCNLSAPFGTPVQVPGVNTSEAEESAWLMPDKLTIFYTSGTSNEDLVYATRSSTTMAFSAPVPLTTLNTTTNNERRPVLTPDGLTLFAVKTGSGTMRIYVSTRTSAVSNFGPFAMVPLGTSNSDSTPWISEDGLTLLFSSSRDATNTSDNDLYRATRASTTAPFGQPLALTELNTPGYERSPVMSKDGLEIFWATTTGGSSTHIWHATRPNTGVAFGSLAEVTELTTFVGEFPDWISPDRCTLLFTSVRPDGPGNYDLWMATRGL
jgi:hypothetical protein